MEGLEASEVKLSESVENKDFRMDSDFWTKKPKKNLHLRYEKIGDILQSSQYGISVSMNEDGKGYPIYRMNEIHNMLCDLFVDKYANISTDEFQKFELKNRDVLFNRTNSFEWVGRTGIYYQNDNIRKTFASYLVRFNPDEKIILPEYLATFLNSKQGVWDIKRRARQSINQTNVNPEEVKEIEIPILSMDLQEKIKKCFETANKNRILSQQIYRQAEELLLETIGLNSPPLEGAGGGQKRYTQNYMSLPYNPKLKDRAKALRKAGMLHEVLVWNLLKKGGIDGLDFDRQKIIGNYIVDFFCAEKNVVIEIDGSSHDDKADYDAQRDEFLKGLGLEIIHIQAKDVLQKFADVERYLRIFFTTLPFGHPSKGGEFTTPSVSTTPSVLCTATPPKEGNKEGNLTNYNIKTFKESFLATGRLDAEYYQKKYEEIVSKIKKQPHDILGNLATFKKSIEPGSDVYADEGLPFIRVSDYNKYGISTPEKCLSDKFCKENAALLQSLSPTKETILFSKDGSVGIAYMAHENMQAVTSGAILHLKVKDKSKILPEYLTLVLNSEVVKQQAERDAGGSIILHWRVGEIENVVVPVVDYKIQRQIADLIEKSFYIRRESEMLLEEAKGMVEREIEGG